MRKDYSEVARNTNDVSVKSAYWVIRTTARRAGTRLPDPGKGEIVSLDYLVKPRHHTRPIQPTDDESTAVFAIERNDGLKDPLLKGRVLAYWPCQQGEGVWRSRHKCHDGYLRRSGQEIRTRSYAVPGKHLSMSGPEGAHPPGLVHRLNGEASAGLKLLYRVS